MANILNNDIKILLVIIFFFSDSKENIIENPKLIISNCQNHIIFNGKNEYYNIITLGKIYTIEKLTGKEVYINETADYGYPYFICDDESDNYFLYADKKFYKINLNSFHEIINLNEEPAYSFDSGTEYVGCIKHYKYDSVNEYDRVEKDEIILYGYQSNKLYFYYIKKKFENDENDVNNFNKKISCKLIEDINFICTHVRNDNNHKIVISLIKLGKLNDKSDIVGYPDNNVFDNEKSDYVILFNTKNKKEKILCSKIHEKEKTNCFKIEFVGGKFCVLDLKVDFNIPLNENNCYFTWFYSEYLICCSWRDIISCCRLNDTYEINNKF